VRKPVVFRDKEILSGAPVFAGTRVPIEFLFQHIIGGEGIDDFLDGYPTISRDQVLALLDQVKEMVLRESEPPDPRSRA
jgi:uncharacterized protein (DUF433 family)